MNEIAILEKLHEEIGTYIFLLGLRAEDEEIHNKRADIRELLSKLPLILPEK